MQYIHSSWRRISDDIRYNNELYHIYLLYDVIYDAWEAFIVFLNDSPKVYTCMCIYIYIQCIYVYGIWYTLRITYTYSRECTRHVNQRSPPLPRSYVFPRFCYAEPSAAAPWLELLPPLLCSQRILRRSYNSIFGNKSNRKRAWHVWHVTRHMTLAWLSPDNLSPQPYCVCQTFQLQMFGGQYSSSTINAKKWRYGIWYPNDNSKPNTYTCIMYICKYKENLFSLGFSVDPLYPSSRKCWGEWLCSMQVMNFILVHGYQIFKRLDSLHGISALTSCGLVL